MPYPLVSPPETMLMSGRIASACVTTSSPSTHARPADGASSVVRILMSVVLPAPFGPRRPNSSPGRTSRSTSRRATKSGPADDRRRSQPFRGLR